MARKTLGGAKGKAIGQKAKPAANPDGDPWDIHYFQRHPEDDPGRALPAKEFLLSCPEGVRGKFNRFVRAMAECPPPKLPRSKYLDPMTGKLAGLHEVRIDGPDRRHYRLFVKLERAGLLDGLNRPSVVLLCGLSKPFKTEARTEDYDRVKALFHEYERRTPRSVLREPAGEREPT